MFLSSYPTTRKSQNVNAGLLRPYAVLISFMLKKATQALKQQVTE